MKTKGKLHYAWYILVVCILMNMTVHALVMQVSNLYMVPMSDDLNVPRTLLSLQSVIMAVGAIITAPIWGKFYKKYDARIILSICTLVAGLATIARAFMPNIWCILIVSAVKGISFAGNTVLPNSILLTRWFQKSRGIAVSTVAIGISLGGVIFNPIVESIITASGWRTADIVVGLVMLVIRLPLILFVVRSSPKDKGLLPFGYKPGEDAAKVSEEDHRGLTAKDALRSPYFYIIIISIMLIYFYGSFQIHISNYAISVGFPVEEASRVASLMMIGLVAGKILLGFVNDRLGGLATLGAAVILVLAAVITLVTSHGAVMPVFIGSFLVGMSAGSLQLVPPMIVRGSMGNKEYGKIYGWAATIGVLVSAVAAPIYAAILDATGTYNTIIAVAAGGMILALVLNLIAYGRARKLWDK